jgi:hypothetical protein
VARTVKRAGKTTLEESFLADGNTMHGSRSERRLLTKIRGRGPGRGFALGPQEEHGQPTPRGGGKGPKK